MGCPAQGWPAGPRHCCLGLSSPCSWVTSQVQSRGITAHKRMAAGGTALWLGLVALVPLVPPAKCWRLCSCLSALAVRDVRAACPALPCTALRWVCPALQPISGAGRNACQIKCTAGWLRAHAPRPLPQCVHSQVCCLPAGSSATHWTLPWRPMTPAGTRRGAPVPCLTFAVWAWTAWTTASSSPALSSFRQAGALSALCVWSPSARSRTTAELYERQQVESPAQGMLLCARGRHDSPRRPAPAAVTVLSSLPCSTLRPTSLSVCSQNALPCKPDCQCTMTMD